MTIQRPLPSSIPSDISPALLSYLECQAKDSYALRELWWYAVLLCMADNEAVWWMHERQVEERMWVFVRTRAGDEFALPKPALSRAQEQELLHHMRASLDSNESDDLDRADSPWHELDVAAYKK